MKRILLASIVLVVAACDGGSSYSSERLAVNAQQNVYAQAQPAPFFDHSLPRSMLTQLYMAKNKAVATYSYVQSEYTGKVLWSCPSIGYPIPANTQLTNPQTVSYPGSSAAVAIAQPEPDGLYSSPSTTGTFVMCTGKSGRVEPKYEERPVTVSPVAMHEQNGSLTDDADGTSSITIDVTAIARPTQAPGVK